MKIETLREEYDKVPDNCPKCGHEFEEIYCRSEKSDRDEVFDLIVLKCPECHAFYAYWIDTSDEYRWGATMQADMEANPEPTGNQPLKNKLKPAVVSKKCAVAYTKSILTKDAKNKEQNRLIQAKLPELYKAGLSLETINFAKNRVINHLKNNKPSPKSLPKLVAAAIYVTSNGVTTDKGLWKHQGEGISERQLEEIFGVTRKTIRKWSEAFLAS